MAFQLLFSLLLSLSTYYSKIQYLRDFFYQIRQRTFDYPDLHRVFFKKHGYKLDLKNPLTHNQRITHKKVFDRNPLIPITSDKYRVREYIREILGKELSDKILIPIYQISKTGQDIPFESMDFEFFMKANHYSGGNMLVKPGIDPEVLRSTCKSWINSSFGQALHEWAYKDIPRRIICEKVLRDESGKIPNDYKFYCFQGKLEMVMVVSDRFENQRRVFIDPDKNVLEGGQMYGNEMLLPLPEIPNYEKMVVIAEKLSKPFAHARIDLYSFGSEIFFGEITHYPGSGLEKFDDYKLDLFFGNKWNK